MKWVGITLPPMLLLLLLLLLVVVELLLLLLPPSQIYSYVSHHFKSLHFIQSGYLKHVACSDSRPELLIMEKQTSDPSSRSKVGCGMPVIDIFTAWKCSLTLTSLILDPERGWPKVTRPVSVWKTTIASLGTLDQSTNAPTLVIRESLSDAQIHTLPTLTASGLILQTSRPDTTCSKYAIYLPSKFSPRFLFLPSSLHLLPLSHFYPSHITLTQLL